jgi:predicted permease
MDEIWKVGLYDFGNSLIVFVLVYSMFFELKIAEFFKLLKSPPIVAIFLGLIFSILSLKIPFFFDTTLDQLGELVGPMIMLGLGLYFTPKFKYIKLTSKIVGIKAILGVGIGLFLMTILPFDELSNKTIVYLTASPVGANILTFAVLSKMDMELPAEIVSLSMIVSFILTPLLFLVL